jgi:hypothetical protein
MEGRIDLERINLVLLGGGSTFAEQLVKIGLSSVDPLTQLINGSHLIELISEEVSRTIRFIVIWNYL